jgi:flagellar protein FlaI
MYDLLRAAFQQRPEYIIVGEIRGVEGLTLFQAMSTGHTCFSTMHAGSVENAVYRLENPPIGVPRVMLTSLDFLILQGQVEVKGRPERRMLALTELNGIDSTTRNLRMNEVFRWDAETDLLRTVTASHVLDETRERRGWSRPMLEEELESRREVLRGLIDRKERDYRSVARAVRAFYQERLVEAQAPSASEKPLGALSR